MIARQYFNGILLISCCVPLLICGCGNKESERTTRFTRVDSLTETYLSLQDSMLLAWNIMINDDNQKIESMNNVLHELAVSGETDPELLQAYKERLEQLKRSRYTQKTMANIHIVEEYDFASNSLVSELVALVESQKQFAYNTTLQKLTDNIRTADQRVALYREQYDLIATRYNRFVEENQAYVKQIDVDTFLEKRPLFQMVAED